MTTASVLEICIDSVASAIESQKGGADRVELCDNLFEGGTTPSEGTIRITRERIDIGLQVIIRPRGGDFVYSEDEFLIMESDIRRAKELGANGVVFGILEPDGGIDMRRNSRLREIAYPMNATFHRAFDVSRGAFESLDRIVELGFDRILTSGQAVSVWEGIHVLRSLVDAAGDRIIVMPGGDLREDTVGRCREETGAREFHMRLEHEVASASAVRRDIPMGGTLRPPELTIHVTDPGRVGRARRAVDTEPSR